MDSELLMRAVRAMGLAKLDDERFQRNDSRLCPYTRWLLTPDGRDFVERRLAEMGYRWECHACPEDRTYTVVVSRNEGEYAEATEVTPAEALIAVVAKLPEMEATK